MGGRVGRPVDGASATMGRGRIGVKVVLFCGGLGLRIREHSESLPKPMVPIGYRPILWHVMRYYAHFGHRDFILCLGYRADAIKDYFVRYSETVSNDFVLRDGGTVEMLGRDIQDWRITFIDTGLNTNIGERLWAVRRLLQDDEMFLANYGDVLTDAPLPALVEQLERTGKSVNFLAVQPKPYTFHLVDIDADCRVTRLADVASSGQWINGGYFVLRRSILDELGPGKDLVGDVIPRLIEREQVIAHPYEGFWAPMDTIRDRQRLEQMIEAGNAPWAVWQQDPAQLEQ